MTNNLIDRALEALLALLMLASVAVAGTEVILRYLFGSSLGWSFEFLLILLTYITFIGAYLAMRMKAHLRILVLYLKLGRNGQMATFLLNQAGIGVTLVVMAGWGWDYTFRFPGKTTLMLHWPVSWLYIVVPLSGAAMLAQLLWDTWLGVRRYRAGLSPEDVSLPGEGEAGGGI